MNSIVRLMSKKRALELAIGELMTASIVEKAGAVDPSMSEDERQMCDIAAHEYDEAIEILKGIQRSEG